MTLEEDITEIKAALLEREVVLFPSIAVHGPGPLVKGRHTLSQIYMPGDNIGCYLHVAVQALDDWSFTYQFRSNDGYPSRTFFARLHSKEESR
jgi:hypothetical protein